MLSALPADTWDDSFGEIEAKLPAADSAPANYRPILAALPVTNQMIEPSKAVAPINPADPARIGYPPTLPIELALRTGSTRAICEAYGISEPEWDQIRIHPVFLGDLQRAVDMVAVEGMSFKLKAKLQAEEMLKTSWRIVHDAATPPSVRADLIKSTMRWAEYDTPPSAGVSGGGPGTNFAIQINFKNP